MFNGKILKGKELTDFKQELLQKLLPIAKEVIKNKLKIFNQGNNGKLIGNIYDPDQNDIEFLHLCTFKTPTFTCATNNSLIFLFYLTFS